MFRLFVVSWLLAALMFMEMPQAEARVISRANPYSSGNIHGVNYRSMQWERQQGNRRPIFGRSYRRGLFRRR